MPAGKLDWLLLPFRVALAIMTLEFLWIYSLAFPRKAAPMAGKMSSVECKSALAGAGASQELLDVAAAFPSIDWTKLFAAFSQGLQVLTNASLTPAQKMSQIFLLVLSVFVTPPAPSPVVPGKPS